jgi:CheY-like chemotaxis protein
MQALVSTFASNQDAAMKTAPLVQGLSILVVDDETLIAMLLEDMLVDIGCTVVGPAPSVAQATALIEREGHTLDGALLDINLRGELVYPVADALAAEGVPFVFVSGYASHGIDPRYASVPALAKPISILTLEAAVKSFGEHRRAKRAV